MKRLVNASDYRKFEVCVTFAGNIGSEVYYDVEASDPDAAIKEAIEMAKDDLEVLSAELVEDHDDEWEVSIGFNGFIGVEEYYTVNGYDEEEAGNNALDEAYWDLEGEISEEYADDEEEEEE